MILRLTHRMFFLWKYYEWLLLKLMLTFTSSSLESLRYLLFTTEKCDISSESNLGVEDKSSDRSLLYIMKKCRPRIDP